MAALLLIIASGAFSQNLKNAKQYLDAKQLDKAKSEIDAFVAKNPNDPQALYLETKIYNAIASNDQFKNLAPDARSIAFEAFKKALASDTKNILLLDLTKDQYKPVFDIYAGYYDAGVAAFNTGATTNNKADFDQAYNLFKDANVVGKYIYSKKWALSEIDTPLVMLTAKAALNAGRKEDAIAYFKILADANIAGTKDDKTGYSLPYQWLAYNYMNAKDEANFFKYAALGKKLFPKDDYFDAVMLDYYRDKKDYDNLFKKYQEIVVAYPDSARYHFSYANEAFNYVYNSDAGTKINNKDALLNTIGTEVQRALALNPNDVSNNWLAGQYYYNTGIDLRDKASAIKGTKPEDVKKRTDLTNQAKEYFNKAIPYVDKAITTVESNGYKKSDKSKYKSLADLMQRIYKSLNQEDKVKFYQQKYDTADSKFVNT